MNAKISEKAREKVREIIHEWKPISWAGYDDDEPDMDKDDPDYKIAKSMLSDELDGCVKSIVKQLSRVKSETDLGHVLHRSLSALDERLGLEMCQQKATVLYKVLKEINAV